jgi:hypothetical protein
MPARLWRWLGHDAFDECHQIAQMEPPEKVI